MEPAESETPRKKLKRIEALGSDPVGKNDTGFEPESCRFANRRADSGRHLRALRTTIYVPVARRPPEAP